MRNRRQLRVNLFIKQYCEKKKMLLSSREEQSISERTVLLDPNFQAGPGILLESGSVGRTGYNYSARNYFRRVAARTFKFLQRSIPKLVAASARNVCFCKFLFIFIT